MKRERCVVRLITVAMVLAFCAITIAGQDPGELDSRARERIEQARAAIVKIKAVDQSNGTISQVLGFFIRKDLIATDSEIIEKRLRLQITATTSNDLVRVVSTGNYFLPYVLVEMQAEVSPLSPGDSERVTVNDSVYMLGDAGKIVAGKVTGTTKIKNTSVFLISLPVDSNNKGAPVFNRYGEVIGIAAKSGDGQSAGLAWPSHLLATLKHLGEPGVGAGAGDGPRFSVRPTPTDTVPPASTGVDTKPVRLSSPPPRYTEAARANNIQGTVILRVQVDENGAVSAVQVVRGLPDGLTEQAIAAARQAKFKPAMKDGKPVKFWIGLEMNFNLR